MLNALTNSSYKTSNAAIGTTFETVKLSLYERNHISYEFFDTAGLNEATNGLVDPAAACDNILKLIEECTEGFNLLILVVRIGAILESDKTNYEMFASNLTNKKIPVLCVITGCENVEPAMMDYVKDNSKHFSDREMIFNQILATCFAQGGRLEEYYRPLRENSSNEVWTAIEKAASCQSIITLTKETGSIKKTYIKMWNAFCRFVKRSSWQIELPYCQNIYEMLDRMGIKDETKKKNISTRFMQVMN
ncbi:unnamed protein product [Adineta ricciae]|uniref:AIG1-type G domain-containing protein n=1 Tax=Adineta ricciae TaxID=249248 RepID=A0A815WP50_ADIRI|nr:unnamed protein product [Adineta ricciae]CAF1662257.1 unnamed protein product [Adineta ricciae]